MLASHPLASAPLAGAATSSLNAIEAQDTAAFIAFAQESGTLEAVEASDTAEISARADPIGDLAATEAQDGFSTPIAYNNIPTVGEPCDALYHFDGNYADSSGKNRNLLTANTSANAGLSGSQTKFGIQSLYFAGSSGGLVDIRIPAHAGLAFNGTDFTFEFWMRASTPQTYGNMFVSAAAAQGTGTSTAIAGGVQIANATNNTPSSGPIKVYLDNGNTLTGTTNPNDNTWHHVAIVREGSGTNNIRLYMNGQKEAQLTYTGLVDFGATYGFIIGRWMNGGSDNIYIGYLDEIRLSNTAKYSANFTPATTAFETNSGITAAFLDRETEDGFIAQAATANVDKFEATEDQDAFSATGSVITISEATLVATEQADTFSADASIVAYADLSDTDTPDAFEASGGIVASADLSATDAQDTFEATSAQVSTGTLDATDTSDTFDGVGLLTSSGTLASSEEQDTFVATGQMVGTGSLSVTETKDTFSGEATRSLDLSVSGTTVSSTTVSIAATYVIASSSATVSTTPVNAVVNRVVVLGSVSETVSQTVVEWRRFVDAETLSETVSGTVLDFYRLRDLDTTSNNLSGHKYFAVRDREFAYSSPTVSANVTKVTLLWERVLPPTSPWTDKPTSSGTWTTVPTPTSPWASVN